MKKKTVGVLVVLCGLMMAGCSNSNGVSLEQYNAVVQERDALQEKLDALTAENESKEASNNEIQASETENVESPVSADEVSSDDIEVVAEYTLSDGIGMYTRRFMILKNNSEQTVDVSTSSLAYAADGTMVSAADASLDALGAGCTSIFYEAFETNAQIDHYDTTFNVAKSEYYESVIQDLEYAQNDINGGAIFQVTNNGDVAAEFVEGYALYFLGGQLVDYNSTYFTDDDSEIKPGQTISQQMTSYESFDRIEFYLTGRASTW